MTATVGYTCFGIPLASSFAFPGLWRTSAPQPEATVLVESELPRWTETSELGWEGVVDGERFLVERSGHGQHRFIHGDRELFQLSGDQRRLLCAPGFPRDTGWWRILLDSVLFTVSLIRGREAIHAGAVATPAGALAVVGRSGAGKSTLLAELRSQGYPLVTDDILTVEVDRECVLAHPGPPLTTLPRERLDGSEVPLDDVGAEVWAAVPVIPAPVPLRRIVLLDRRWRSEATIERVASPLALLLTHLLTFPRTTIREISRFDTASSLATRTELCRLTADLNTPPQELATLATQGLQVARRGPRRGELR